MTDRYEEWSPWTEAPTDIQPALTGDRRVNVVIVGGGITGLNAAIGLSDAGVDVALIESDFCGYGASGRNAGHLTPTIGKDFPTMVKAFGEERAANLAKFGEDCVLHTEKTFERYGIDCDYKPTGNIVGGVHAKHRDPLLKAVELSHGLGIDVDFVDEANARERALPPFVRFGVHERRGGHLNPGKYVQALRSVALRKGVRIFEHSAVNDIAEKSGRVIVRTAQGSMEADRLIVATNAYTPVTLGRKRDQVLPFRVTLWRTPVLTPKQREALGWHNEEGIYTSHESLESYRLLPDGRLSGGSKWVQYGYGSTLVPGEMPDVFDQYDVLLKQRFGFVPDMRIEQFWGGWIAMTLDFLPYFYGEKNDRHLYAIGCNGHGVAQCTMFGKMLADRVLGRRNEHDRLLDRRVMPLPPEPFRWLVIKALGSSIRRADAATDKDILSFNVD